MAGLQSENVQKGAPISLPQFNAEGDLPPGVHKATIEQVLERFGRGLPQRRTVAGRLLRLYELAGLTSKLARFVVFGSFVTAKAAPNDVDVVLLMEDDFDLTQVVGEASILFRHMEAEAFFGASVFWTTRSGAFGGEDAMIQYWQTRRGSGLRGIVEITRDRS